MSRDSVIKNRELDTSMEQQREASLKIMGNSIDSEQTVLKQLRAPPRHLPQYINLQHQKVNPSSPRLTSKTPIRKRAPLGEPKQ